MISYDYCIFSNSPKFTSALYVNFFLFLILVIIDILFDFNNTGIIYLKNAIRAYPFVYLNILIRYLCAL